MTFDDELKKAGITQALDKVLPALTFSSDLKFNHSAYDTTLVQVIDDDGQISLRLSAGAFFDLCKKARIVKSIFCTHCNSNNHVKRGKSKKMLQQYHCKTCDKNFISAMYPDVSRL